MNTMNTSIDFLAVGDIVTEPFIRLKDAHVNCRIDTNSCEICMRWGDKIPYESATLCAGVGNASNAAVAAARLGLSSSLCAYVGEDRYGEECLDVLKNEHVGTEYMVVEMGKKTNYHYVLWYEDERTILVKHEDFGYKFSAPRKNPRWVYITSLGAESLPYQLEIANWLQKNPDIKVAFQPGTFQMNVGFEKLLAFYKRSEVFFCNVEEAKRILKSESSDTKELMKGIHSLGPKNVVITDGPKGAYAFDGNRNWFMPPYPDPKPPYERTGAGDAFASTFTVALALGKPISEALMWGPINSMSVVQNIGAQKGLLSREKLEEFLKNAPEGYSAKEI